MNQISAGLVEGTRQRIAEYSLEQGQQLAKQFGEEQPNVMAYLLGIDSNLLDQEERALLFYTGAVIWQIMSQGDKPLPMVTSEMIQAAGEANRKMLEPIAGLTDADAVVVVSTLIQSYGQPELLKYVIRALMGVARENEVRQDNLGTMMINLKTVIDCFN